MADDTNPFAQAMGYFWSTPQSNSPASVQALRQRMAMAMLMQKRKYPTTFGEGLSAIGEALGERSLMRQMEQEATAASAETDKQIKAVTPGAISSSAVEGEEPAAKTAAAPPAAAGTSISGLSPNAAAWHAFAVKPADQGGLGLQSHQAAGLVGNLQQESTPNIKPWGVVGDAGTAFGAAQWRNERFNNLKQFAAANGMDYRTTEAQQAFMRHEMMGSGLYGGGSEAGAYQNLLAAKDPRGAATAFNRTYERSADRSGRREINAENINRILADPNAAPRDKLAAISAMQSPTPADQAHESRIADVVGMTRGPTGNVYPQTAAARSGDVMSDAPQPGLAGGPGPTMGGAVADTMQQRQQMMQPPQPPTPQVGPQLAQAPGQGAFPPVSADVKPIIPGGGFPQVMPQIQAAPPRNPIQVAPQPGVPPPDYEYAPQDRPIPEPPTKPGPGPYERKYAPVLNQDVDQRKKDAVKYYIDVERAAADAKYQEQQKRVEFEKQDALKEREQNRLYLQNLKEQRGKMASQEAITAKTRAETPGALAKSTSEQLDTAFKQRVGQDREPFIQAFAKDKVAAQAAVNRLKSARLVQEALDSGFVISGAGGDMKFDLAKIAAAFNLKDAAQVAAKSEQYRLASKALISYGIQQFQPGDPRITEGDLAQAQGQTGTLTQQRDSQKLLNKVIMEEANQTIGKYEDDREQYLRGDPLHQRFKVETSPVDPAWRSELLKNPEDDIAKREFDRRYGAGAADLEIRRARRRMHREDD